MNKSKKRIAVFTLIAVCIVIVAVVLSLSGTFGRIRLSLAESGEVCDGILPGDEIEHITEIPDGEIRYLINKKVRFENPYSTGNFMFENPQVCDYDIVFVVYDSDGEEIYKSPMIKPGQYLEEDKLSAVVKSGTYDCSYSAEAYSAGEFIGEINGVITITVG